MNNCLRKISAALVVILLLIGILDINLMVANAADVTSGVVILDNGENFSSDPHMTVLPDGRIIATDGNKLVEYENGVAKRFLNFSSAMTYVKGVVYNSKNNKVYVIGINGDLGNRRRFIYVINIDTITIDYTYNVQDDDSSWRAYALDPNSGDLVLIEKDKNSVGDETTSYLKFTPTYSSSSARLSPNTYNTNDTMVRANGSEFFTLGSNRVYKYSVGSGDVYGSVFYDADSYIETLAANSNGNIFVGCGQGKFAILNATGTPIVNIKTWSFGSSTSIRYAFDRPDGSWIIGDGVNFQIIGADGSLGTTFTISSFVNVGATMGADGSVYVYGKDAATKGLRYVKIYNNGLSTPTISSATISSVTLSNILYDGKTITNNVVLQTSNDGINFTDHSTFTGSSITFNPRGRTFFYAKVIYRAQDVVIYGPRITIAIPPTVPTGLTISQSGGLNWDKERGRGYVVLNWGPSSGALGYKVHVFDGYQYRTFDVGNITTWDSKMWKIYPEESWLNAQANNTITTDPFNKVKGGLDLADNPNLLYQKTVGTTYDSSTNYWFRVSAYNSGAESTPCTPVTITLPNRTDSMAPAGNIFINNGDLKTGTSNVKIRVSASDTGGSGIKDFRLSKDGSVWEAYQPYMTNEFDYVLTPGTGTRDVYVQFRDIAGNESIVYKASIYVKDDLAGATASIKINNDEEYTWSDAVKLNIFVTDDLTPIDQLLFRFSNDGKVWTDWEGWNAVGFLKDYTLPSVAVKEIQNVYMQVRDGAGNITTVGDSIMHYKDEITYKEERKNEVIQDSLNTDITPPAIKTLEVAGKVTVITGDSVNISLIATDNVTAKENLKVDYSFDGITFTVLGSYTPTITIPVSGTGLKTLYIKVIDEMGNEEIGVLTFFKL